MNIKIELVFIILLSLVILIGLFWSIRTEKRLRKFFSGKKAKDLEHVIHELEQEIIRLKASKQEIEQEIALLHQKARKSIRGLDMIRFNPFPDQGGNQSFAIGMLNEDGDGLVMSSLYSRERMSVFAKPVKAGKSEYELSEEEKEALRRARAN